eukprot:CAMPEP_0169187696 /NCGR_PEP_ID=MMETSP1016-20121227/3065_1 /TAXON_ID=342587 /ORGANISM="Karlodinium micrum, Strain CCMP2283" /LENGTH=400 /DNA_ID=CAMNT_0009263679 /DNA_START=19 /DNA_END=1217 /DNA_ORIENTATION=-
MTDAKRKSCWDQGGPGSSAGGGGNGPSTDVGVSSLAEEIMRATQRLGPSLGRRLKEEGVQGEMQMRVGDWVCVRCKCFMFKKLTSCRICSTPLERSVGPNIRGAAQTINDIAIDGPPWKRNKLPFLPPGLCIRNGMVCVDKPEQFVKQIQIPAEDKGFLIGRKGAVLDGIRKDSNAHIKLECAQDDSHATLIIKGKQEEVDRAELLIHSKLAEMNLPGHRHEEKLVVVPKEFIGETIGPGGHHLTRIAEQTNCKVKFVEARMYDEAAEPDAQVCYIKGPPDMVALAEQFLHARVEEVKQLHEKRKQAELAIVPGLAAPSVAGQFHMAQPGGSSSSNDGALSLNAVDNAAVTNSGADAVPQVAHPAQPLQEDVMSNVPAAFMKVQAVNQARPTQQEEWESA